MSEEEKPRKAQKTFREPLVYEVGKDISQEKYEEVLTSIADWFREFRPDHKEPAADARSRVKACLEGRTLKGEKWYTAWSAPLKSRIAMLCRYDIDKMEPLRKGDEKTRLAKQKAKEKVDRKRRERRGAGDPYIPDITRKEQPGQLKYGDAEMPITEAEQRKWREYRDAYLEQFPELKTVNAESELRILCDLQVVHDRNRMKLLNGDRMGAQDMLEHMKLIEVAKKSLNIHPDQVAKRVKSEEGSSVAEAAARFDAMPKEVRDRFTAEEFLMLFQMYAQPSPRQDSGGYQLDEVGLFGATRCRTCACAKCGTRNYAGFSIDEVTKHLVDKGWLVPVEETPVDPAVAAIVAGSDAPDGGAAI